MSSKYERMKRTKNLRWIKKTVIGTDDDVLAEFGAARLCWDQEALIEIIHNAKWAAGSIAAINYITNPDIIDRIADDQFIPRLPFMSAPIKTMANAPQVREAAARKSVNQPLLGRLAIYDKKIYKAAVEALTDEALLAEVAKTAEWERAGVLAFRKLTDETLRRSVHGEDAKPINRFEAAYELGDCETLVKVFINTPEIQTRQETLNRMEKAVEMLTDQALLVEVAKTAAWGTLGALAFSKLTDETLRRSVCAQDVKPENRLGAADELGDYETLMEIFKKDPDISIRKRALCLLEKANYPDRVKWMRDTALHDRYIDVRIAAYEYLPQYNEKAVSEFGKLYNEHHHIRAAAAEALMDIFEQDRFALAVLGRAAIKLIEGPRETSETPYLNEVMWNGTYADEPGSHTDTGIGIEFRQYENFDACD